MALYGPALVDTVGLGNVEVTGGALMLSKGTANLVLHSLSGKYKFLFFFFSKFS